MSDAASCKITADQEHPDAAHPSRSGPASDDRPERYLAVVGSRDFPDLDRVRLFIQGLSPQTIIVSGGARGVDRCAAHAARARGLRVIELFADWQRFGRRAGYLRNELIVRRCGRMVAFWDGSSPGTRHSIDLARKLGRSVVIHTPWI
jgi:YspA, cpYpsA-related SLOG family